MVGDQHNDDSVLQPDRPLLREAERYARVGERTFYNWYTMLSAEEQRIVKQHMEQRD